MDLLKTIGKQVSFQLFGKTVSVLSTFISLGLVARNYGESGTGIFTLALTYLAIFFLFADLGLNAYILPRLSKFPEEANKIINSRFYYSCVLALLSILILPFLPFSSLPFVVSVLIGALSIVLFGLYNSTNLIFQSKLRYDLSNIASALSSIAVIPFYFYLVVNKPPIEYLALAPLAGWIINDLIAFFLVRKLYHFKITPPDLSFALDTLKKAWPISLTLILNVIYFRTDSFILSSYRSYSEVGVYNLAYQVFQTILVLPTFIMNSYYPLMIKKLSEDKRGFLKQLRKIIAGLLFLSILATVSSLIFSPFIFNLLKGGKGFEGSIISLNILSLSFPAYFISSVFMWTLVTLGKNKALVSIYFLGLLVNLILNFIFIPKYSFIAASWTTGISEYLILISQIIILIEYLSREEK